MLLGVVSQLVGSLRHFLTVNQGCRGWVRVVEHCGHFRRIVEDQ